MRAVKFFEIGQQAALKQGAEIIFWSYCSVAFSTAESKALCRVRVKVGAVSANIEIDKLV